jgi:hypothetical protein
MWAVYKKKKLISVGETKSLAMQGTLGLFNYRWTHQTI